MRRSRLFKCALPENGGDARRRIVENVDTHPEGLNLAEVESAREQHVKINYPHNNRRRGGYIYGSASQPL